MNLFETCFPVISLSKFKNGLEIKIADRLYVLTSNKGQYFAFPSRCPHRGTSLKFGKIKEGSITCPYHGWKINSSGKVDHPYDPTFKCKVEVIQLEEKYDTLWMNLKNNAIPVNVQSGLSFTGSLSFILSAPFHVVLDNFNEGSHTAFVHKVIGPKESQVREIDFSWEDREDHVFIKYEGPQRPNFIYNGPFWKTYLNWNIFWTTHFNPVRMDYRSQWISRVTGKKWWMKNQNVYFITPCGKDKTWLHAITFTEIPSFLTAFSFFIKWITKYLTTNQIMEDEIFYKQISDLPFSLKSFRLDQFDHPLVAIRKKVDDSYYLGLKDS